jgi:hypothetical protein
MKSFGYHCQLARCTGSTSAFGLSKSSFPTLSSSSLQSQLVNTVDGSSLDWDDRIGLQRKWTNPEKGWQVAVDWRPTPFGAGLFAAEDIPKDTILRVGRLGVNLIEFKSGEEIESFCNNSASASAGASAATPHEYAARLRYVKDYLWGLNKEADERGYDLDLNQVSPDRFFGMWIPGNGLNHNIEPNTVYRPSFAKEGGIIDLVALCDISQDDELFDDYRRHGTAPEWLKAFSSTHNVTLNFAGCNDFVDVDP